MIVTRTSSVRGWHKLRRAAGPACCRTTPRQSPPSLADSAPGDQPPQSQFPPPAAPRSSPASFLYNRAAASAAERAFHPADRRHSPRRCRSALPNRCQPLPAHLQGVPPKPPPKRKPRQVHQQGHKLSAADTTEPQDTMPFSYSSPLIDKPLFVLYNSYILFYLYKSFIPWAVLFASSRPSP